MTNICIKLSISKKMYKKQQKNIIKAAVRGKKLVGLSLFRSICRQVAQGSVLWEERIVMRATACEL